MSFANLINLTYQALSIDFTVFGVTINFFQVWAFGMVASLIGYILYLLRGD